MKVRIFPKIGFLVVCAALWFQAPAATAAIVGTEEMAVPADSERTKVQSFLDRADVKDRLQTLGVKGLLVKDRVDAMSDEEVRTLALKIDSLPAGGALSSLSNSDLVIILLLLIFVAIIA